MKEVARLRREKEKVEIKQRILANALHLAKLEGWQSVSIRKIATSIEYTTSVVYEHFKNKEQILTALSSEGFTEFQRICEETVARTNSPQEALECLGVAMLHFAYTHAEYYQVMFNLEGVVCKNEKSINATYIKNIIAQATAEKNTDLLFLNWWSIVYGFINLCLVDLKRVELSAQEMMLRSFIQRFLRSI
jgi:AcrR family transcriptional regulator